MKYKERLAEYLVILILGIFFLNLYLCREDNGLNLMKDAQEDEIVYESGWRWKAEEDLVSFPLIREAADTEEPAVMWNVLPEVSDHFVLTLYEQTQGVCISIDGEQVYRSLFDERTGDPVLLGNKVIQIPMKEEYSGKEIIIELYPAAGMKNLKMAQIFLCPASEFELFYIREHIGSLLFLAILLVIGTVLLLVYGWQRVKRQQYDYSSCLHLGIFVLVCMIWMSTDTMVLQVITRKPVLCAMLSFCSFMLLPIPMICFVYSITERKHKSLVVMQFLLALNCIIQILLQIAEVQSFPKMLIYTHILFVITILVLLVSVLKEYKKNHRWYTDSMAGAVWALSAFGIIALFCFYANVKIQYLQLIQMGIFLFILLLMRMMLKRIFTSINEQTAGRIYQEIAYQDVMTGVYNRRAFEEALQKLQEDEERKERCAMIEFDVNNLKVVNDQHGHKAGDEIIKQAARTMSEVFGEMGSIFRIGGDEFVVLTESTREEIETGLHIFTKKIALYDRISPYGLSVAKGYAMVGETTDENLERILSMADKRMYEDKAEMKRN